ncbi:MAG: DNA methyltransferase, partial [candidate division NC10 bacterium]|nr:DNA methyltransferase [candidate division NC10 bacterium]
MRSVNGTSNKLAAEDRLAHDWYRFVLSFPPHLVRDYLHRFGMDRDSMVLDPFCGTGTTIVECKKLDIPSVGVEANPFAYFASIVKTDWSPDPDELLKHAREVAELASKKLASEGFDDQSPLPLFNRTRGAGPGCTEALRKLPPEKEKLLLANSISPLPLHKTLVLLECLDQI